MIISEVISDTSDSSNKLLRCLPLAQRLWKLYICLPSLPCTRNGHGIFFVQQDTRRNLLAPPFPLWPSNIDDIWDLQSYSIYNITMMKRHEGKAKIIPIMLALIVVKPLNQCQWSQSSNFWLHEKNKHLFKPLLAGFSITYNQKSFLTDRIL